MVCIFVVIVNFKQGVACVLSSTYKYQYLLFKLRFKSFIILFNCKLSKNNENKTS